MNFHQRSSDNIEWQAPNPKKTIELKGQLIEESIVIPWPKYEEDKIEMYICL